MRGIACPGSFYRVEDLVNRMERYGIEKALVYHSMAREYNPAEGNKMLMEEIKDYPSLIPVWVVMHHHTNEFPEPGELAGQMKNSGIKAVRMFPAAWEQNYSTSEWNCGELFSFFEDYRIPLLIGLDQLGWDGLNTLCSSHPELRIILTSVDYRVDRNLYALMEKFRNIYIETIGYKVHSGIEEICGRFGAERLIFGSGMPVLSGGSAVSMINYSRISDREKRMIAADNIKALLGGVLL
jgi:predicted TIM-barrel fold metal-dependent hydrolase